MCVQGRFAVCVVSKEILPLPSRVVVRQCPDTLLGEILASLSAPTQVLALQRIIRSNG